MSERMRELTGSPRVAPSILSADMSKLGAQIEEVMDAGARVIHFDVMDGHFVPPITIGPLVLSAIADQVHDAGGAVDVHLMIEAAVRQLGCLAGVAINPGTPVEAVQELRGMADIALCMTVNPGWGGQSFIET